MADKILIVDDEREIADLIELYLKSENFEVYKFYSAEGALECIETAEPDLAILDIMLPGEVSGLALCQKIRENHKYPVIMLTAKDSETDKITGLTLGAEAQLRRYKKYNDGAAPARNDGGVITHSGLVIDVDTHEVTLNEKPLTLTPTEFSILRILCERKGSVVSSENLFREIWGDEYFTKSSNTITVHIRHLREKMGDTMDNPKYIRTVWGVGYKIEK